MPLSRSILLHGYKLLTDNRTRAKIWATERGQTVVPVVSRPFKSPLSLSALGGVIRRRSSINKVHYMRQNSKSCKTVSDGRCIPKLFPMGCLASSSTSSLTLWEYPSSSSGGR